jgi:SWI/SNF-related matrix-associated actin-dependent regulator of chromatin subfamily B protein 1
MRYTAVSTETDQPISLRPEASPPPNTKFCYYPRIKCKDCPGKLYTPGPEKGVENFEVHLRNRQHRHQVSKRIGDHGMNMSLAAAAQITEGGKFKA